MTWEGPGAYGRPMVKAVFPGSFDPPTYGHVNLIERARTIFEEVLVVVAVNPGKSSVFSAEERMDFMRDIIAPWPNVSLHMYDSLIVNFAKQHNCKVLLRGVRSVQDFSYEFELSVMNKGLASDIETLFMPTDSKYFVLRSSAIKDLASFGGDVSSMVPPIVEKALRRFHPNQQA